MRKVLLHKALVLISILCFLFAITNQISVANFRFDYPLPSFIVEKFGIFRSSGRMIWLPIYLGFVATMILALRQKKNQFMMGIFVSLLALVQVIDTQEGWSALKFKANSSTQMSRGFDSKWFELARDHTSILVVPEGNENSFWPTIGLIASTLNLKTNCVYLARVNLLEVQNQRSRILNQLESNKLDEDVIYVLSESQMLDLDKTIEKTNVTLLKLDGLNVLYRDS